MKWRIFRNGLMQVHLWLALILCLPMIIIGISGSALLLQREILARSIPSATATGSRQTIPNIVAAAEKSAPGGMIASRVELPRAGGSPSSVRFHSTDGSGPEIDFYVDPVSLKLLGSSEVVERGPILAFFITIHAFLAMPPPIGLPFVGWNGVIMTFMGLSGLILWWPRKGQWRHAFLMRRGTRGLAFHFDLHRIAGIWSLVLLLAVSTSGVYLTFPQSIGPFVRAHIPGTDTTSTPQPGFVAGTGPIDAEKAIALAQAAIPAARVTGLELPGAEPTFVVELEPRDLGPTDPHVQVVMDENTAEITYIDDPRNYSLPEKLLNWQHLLHFGVGLGLVWTILVFISGFLPLLFAITGVTVWWKKRQGGKSSLAASAWEQDEGKTETARI